MKVSRNLLNVSVELKVQEFIFPFPSLLTSSMKFINRISSSLTNGCRMFIKPIKTILMWIDYSLTIVACFYCWWLLTHFFYKKPVISLKIRNFLRKTFNFRTAFFEDYMLGICVVTPFGIFVPNFYFDLGNFCWEFCHFIKIHFFFRSFWKFDAVVLKQS